MIDGSEKRNRQLAFELQNSHVCEKRSNCITSYSLHKTKFDLAGSWTSRNKNIVFLVEIQIRCNFFQGARAEMTR